MPFLDTRVSCLYTVSLSVPQINVLGVCLQLPLQDPAFIRGPALNRENTVILIQLV